MTSLHRIAPTLLVGILVMAAPLLAAQPTALTATFGERSITIQGVTPGERVAVFGLSHEPLTTRTPITPAIVVRAEILTDTDGDGVVRFDLPVPVPLQGIWTAVGLTSGVHRAFPTPGFEPRLIALVPELLRNDNAGQLSKLEWPFSEIDLFVVRPGEGAWRRYAAKFSGSDENRDNGQRALRLDVSSMIRIGDSPEGPQRFRNGDIVAIFDRRQMQYGILEVGR